MINGTLATVWGVLDWAELADRADRAAAQIGTRIGPGDVEAVRRRTELLREVGGRSGSGQVQNTARARLTREVAAYLDAEGPEPCSW
ncbi:hypothetical protein [Embleya sp. MST-111070]|uniref:hypothetical protein n=1 Tax=Embleya sp. MST-111070 TaxID=3398231 RepID=UPI003F7396E7